MSEPPKKKLESAAEVLQGLLDNVQSPLSDQFRRWQLWNNWTAVVGPRLAKNTEPVRFDRGTLFLWVPSSSWVQQLQFFKDDILARVNAHVGANWAKRLHFTTDRGAIPQDPESRQDLSARIKGLKP